MSKGIKQQIKGIPLLGAVAEYTYVRLKKAGIQWVDFTWAFRNARLYHKESQVDFDEQWVTRLGRGGKYDDISTYTDPDEVAGEIRGDDEYLMAIIPEGAKVLEIGCGNGRLGYLLTKHRHCHWVGLDISTVAVDEAKSKGLEAYVCDLDNMQDPIFDKLRETTWDYIVSAWTIQLLHKPEELVQLLGELGDVQLHGTWNAGYWVSRLRMLFGRFPIYSWQGSQEGKLIYPYAYGAYNRHWTFTDFRQWAKDLGFKAEPAGLGNKFPMKTAALKQRMLWPSVRSGRVLWQLKKL